MIKLYLDSLRKRKRTQINKSRNERGDITTNFTEIKRIIRKYYGQLYANKLDKLDEMNKFLKILNVPRLNDEEIGTLNRPKTNN